MAELMIAAPGIMAFLLIIYAVILILLPFFVLRIRREAINTSADIRRIRSIIEAVVPDSKKPKPPAAPEVVSVGGRTVRVCPSCSHPNEMQDAKCAKCAARLLA